jgi:hypothetical protein
MENNELQYDEVMLDHAHMTGSFLVALGAMRALISREGQYAPAIALVATGLATMAASTYLNRK